VAVIGEVPSGFLCANRIEIPQFRPALGTGHNRRRDPAGISACRTGHDTFGLERLVNAYLSSSVKLLDAGAHSECSASQKVASRHRRVRALAHTVLTYPAAAAPSPVCADATNPRRHY
jgi:hypothetical protein